MRTEPVRLPASRSYVFGLCVDDIARLRGRAGAVTPVPVDYAGPYGRGKLVR